LQNEPTNNEYKDLLMDDLEDFNCHQLRAAENIEANKLRIAKQYIKKVKNKQFAEGDLVWKVNLSIGSVSLANGHLLIGTVHIESSVVCLVVH